MMFGIRDEFDYFECAKCGCVQLCEIPANLSKYYPEDYYSYSVPSNSTNPLTRHLKRKRAGFAMGYEKSALGRMLVRWFGVGGTWMRHVRPDMPVLDVGCGVGTLLLALRDIGFRNLTGIDPYIEDDIHYEGVNIYKRTLADTEGNYGFIMLHHSFEHMEDPKHVLGQVHRLLKPAHHVLIRIPVAASYAFRTYGRDWIQLDAPRHLFLHTEESIGILASQTGFEVTDIDYDSTSFQFWGSEQYQRDIPLRRDERSYDTIPHNSPFTKVQLRSFEAKAQTLNEEGQGDQACFYLRKI
jgi:SAM-dependent methyltransferase